MESLQLQTIPTPATFAEMKKELADIHNGTFDRLQELRVIYQASKEQYMAELNKMTVAELKKMVFYRPDDKKADIIRKVISAYAGYFLCGKSVICQYHFDGKDSERNKDAEQKVMDSVTVAEFEQWAQEKRADIEARKKCFTNPETLEEFETFARVLGTTKLTTEQLKRFDELRADKIREREDLNKVKNVEAVEGAEFTYHETTHTQKGHALFVCSLNNRVDSDTFKSLSNRAKLFGGYYSSYCKGGAVAGFTFTDAEAAQKFLEGGSNQKQVDEKQEYKLMSRSETLRAKGEKLIEQAEEELNRDRKDNTARRARMAANAEARAEGNIRFGKTLISIADGIEAGNIKYLDRINNMTELETLYSVLNSARNKEARAKNTNREELQASDETANYAEIPLPYLYKSEAAKYLPLLYRVKGRKMAAARMAKRLKECKNDFLVVSTTQGLEDFETLFCSAVSGVLDTYVADRYKGCLASYKRLSRAGLLPLPVLRSAVRELIAIKENPQPESNTQREIKEKVRALIGRKIEGFFPTPSDLAHELVQMAEIKEGETVLEPSAGIGHIAEAITEAHPDNALTVIEQYSTLSDILSLKGFEPLNEDFLKHSGTYDKIVMNPPFEDLQDIDHVLHAYSLLNEGGRLVAIMANNKGGERQKVKDFAQFVENNGQIIENEPDAFLSSFRPTSVRTITVILNK